MPRSVLKEFVFPEAFSSAAFPQKLPMIPLPCTLKVGEATGVLWIKSNLNLAANEQSSSLKTQRVSDKGFTWCFAKLQTMSPVANVLSHCRGQTQVA